MATTSMTNDTFSKANTAATDFKNKLQDGSSSLENISQNTGKRLGEMASGLADTASEYVKTGRSYVKENPVKGVAIAAAAGIVAGGILTMALRRRQ